MTSKPEPVADERLLDAHDLALAALREITPADTIGPAAGYTVEEGGAVSLRFHTRLAGYPGWYWTVSVAVVDDSEPTVLEAELLPGEGALLAPDWVPWATRLAEYQAAQAAAAVADDDADDDDLDDSDDDEADDDDDSDDSDDDDDDEEPQARLHAGDLDGVDIDELDETADDSDEEESDDSDDEDSDDDSDDDDSDDDDSDDSDDDERERSY